MLTIITACSRPNNLDILKEHILFEYIEKWIIVYDTSKDRIYEKRYADPQIEEYFHDAGGVFGNAQRNYGISLVKKGHIYFLDDDNIIHPRFWQLIPHLEENTFFTFDQIHVDKNFVMQGYNIIECSIDLAQFVVPVSLLGDVRFILDKYSADGAFIEKLNENNPFSFKYIKGVYAYYNQVNFL